MRQDLLPEKHALHVTAANGVPFQVTLTTPHDTRTPPCVEFLDRRYVTQRDPRGQLISTYYADDLARDQDPNNVHGLDLDGGNDDWTIDAVTMNLILLWLSHHLAPREH